MTKHAVSFVQGFAGLLTLLLETRDVFDVQMHLNAVKQRRGRLFFLGVGGSAANASHAVNDFRKLCGMECYAPTDNVAELTAWTNDLTWSDSFEPWLETSRLTSDDAVFVLSVGGGTERASPNIVRALKCAKLRGATILGIVGRDGGATLKMATACILVPTVDDDHITPYVESMQSVLLHLFCTDPALRV